MESKQETLKVGNDLQAAVESTRGAGLLQNRTVRRKT